MQNYKSSANSMQLYKTNKFKYGIIFGLGTAIPSTIVTVLIFSLKIKLTKSEKAGIVLGLIALIILLTSIGAYLGKKKDDKVFLKNSTSPGVFPQEDSKRKDDHKFTDYVPPMGYNKENPERQGDKELQEIPASSSNTSEEKKPNEIPIANRKAFDNYCDRIKSRLNIKYNTLNCVYTSNGQYHIYKAPKDQINQIITKIKEVLQEDYSLLESNENDILSQAILGKYVLQSLLNIQDVSKNKDNIVIAMQKIPGYNAIKNNFLLAASLFTVHDNQDNESPVYIKKDIIEQAKIIKYNNFEKDIQVLQGLLPKIKLEPDKEVNTDLERTSASDIHNQPIALNR